jgi:hypothetical protein
VGRGQVERHCDHFEQNCYQIVLDRDQSNHVSLTNELIALAYNMFNKKK